MSYLRPFTRTVPINNEACDIVERLFEEFLLPVFTDIPYIPRNIIAKSKKQYFNSWDFEGDDYSIEIKGVFQRNYSNPIFACSSAKFSNIKDKKKIYIMWYVTKTPEDIINNPSISSLKWYSYRYNKEQFIEDINKNLITIKINNFGQMTHYFNKSLLKEIQ